jgi:hypothetical protein
MTDNLPAIASQGGALVAGGGNPFLDAAEDMGASSGALFMKFDGNKGEYSFGKDQEELELGTRLAMNHRELKRGWICWKDGEVQGEVMVRIMDGPPPSKSSLEDHGPYDDDKDGWREQSSVQFRDIESGEEFLFKTSSKGGRIAVANLVRDFGKEFAKHPNELAIVELQNVSFDAKDEKGKKLGKKYAPVFKVAAWESEEALIAKFEAANAAEEDAKEEEDVPVNTKAATGGRRRNF